jgi:general secretion pathway protein B
MSYILDALRKADAERRGVTAPVGLTEPAVLVSPNDTDADLPPTTAKPWIWVLGGMGLVLLAAVGWHLWRDTGTPAPVVAAAAPTPEAVTLVPEPALPPVPVPDADALPRFPPPLPDPPKAEPPTPERRAEAPAPLPVPGDRRAPPPGISVVPAPAAPAAPGERVIALGDLPEGLRRDFPRLTVGGAMYSSQAADRMVVLNGQVFHEGDAVGKELRLRQIKLKSAVFDFRGHRVEVGY